MDNSQEQSTFITEGNIIWYNPDPSIHPYKKAKIKKIDRISNTLNLEILENSENLQKIEISKIEEASIKPVRNFLVSNLEIINGPELIEYMRWILNKNERYFNLNKALFFINNNKKIKNFFEIEKCKKILENGKIDNYSNAPDFEMFISENLHFLKFFNNNQYLFFLGQKNSAKTVHFKFFLDFIEKLFFEKNEKLKKKIRAILLIFFSVINFLDKNGKNENFSFNTYKFIFDKNFQFAGIKLKLISLYATFITEKKNIYDLPIIMFLTKKYYSKKNQNLNHLKEIFDNKKIEKSTFDIFEKYSKDIFSAFEILNFPKKFLDKIFLTFRILLNFINLKIERNLENEWEIEKNEIYKDLIFLLKIKENEFMDILIKVSNTNDRSMQFGKNNQKSFRDYISTIVYVIYEKLVYEIVDVLNLNFECNEKLKNSENDIFSKNDKNPKNSKNDENPKNGENGQKELNLENYKWICLVENCGFRNKKINGFDDFHINYLNERIFLHYADTTINDEKKIYLNEGLQKYFPNNLKFNSESGNVVKLINNLRKPPGIYQILETVNRLNKTNKSFINEIRKFLKNTNLIKLLKNGLVEIQHTFGEVIYDFSDFVPKNKYFLISDYKNLFLNLNFDFLSKHDIISESVNKNYKSDVYRNFLFHFLENTKKNSVSNFMNCFNFTDNDINNIILQMKIFKLEDIIKLIKELFPYKITLNLFVKRYLEILTNENKFFYEIKNFDTKLHDFSKEIVDFVYKGGIRPKILYGKTMIFSNNFFLKELESRLLEIKNREKKWKNYLLIKIKRFLFVIKARRGFIKIKKDKKLAKEIILKMKIVLIKKSEYKKKLRIIKKLQKKRRNITFMRKMRICLKKIKRLKETFLTFFLRAQFLKKRKMIIKVQRRARIFVAISKIRKKIFVKKILDEVILRAVTKNSEKLLKNIKKGFSKFLLKQVIFLKNRKILGNFIKYIKNEILEKKVRIIQRCYRRYNFLKWYKKMKKSIIIIQKNLKMYMWRKNFLIMKNGIIKIQKIFFEKRIITKKEILGNFYNSEKLENLLKKNCEKIIKKNFDVNKKKILKRISKYENLLKKMKHNKPLFFSNLINLEISPNLEKEDQFSILEGFSRFLEKIEKNENEYFFEMRINNDNIWFITNLKKIYIWGKINFMKLKTKINELKEISVFGDFPEFIENGDSSTTLLYSKKNEIKFFGDFEIFGKNGKIKKKNDKITTEFNSEFKIAQICQNGKNLTILSKKGEILCWPFYNPKKQKIGRLKLTLKKKITKIACGVDFSIFLTKNGIVYSLTNTNNCGEAGNGSFITNKKIYEIKYFQVIKENIVQIAVGYKHVVVLTMKNKIFCWGSNFKNQIGLKFKLNYPTPKFVKLGLVLKSNEKITKIFAGKFSSFAILKNQKIYLWGKINKKSKLPKLFDFSDFLNLEKKSKFFDFWKNSDFFVFKIKSFWNDFMSVTYFQIFDLNLMILKKKSKIIYNKLENFWGPENRILPELENYEKIEKKYLDHFPNFLKSEKNKKNSNSENSLFLVNNELVEKFVSVNNKTFSMEDVFLNWKNFLEKYKNLKNKEILDDEEKEFLEFFLKMKQILLT